MKQILFDVAFKRYAKETGIIFDLMKITNIEKIREISSTYDFDIQSGFTVSKPYYYLLNLGLNIPHMVKNDKQTDTCVNLLTHLLDINNIGVFERVIKEVVGIEFIIRFLEENEYIENFKKNLSAELPLFYNKESNIIEKYFESLDSIQNFIMKSFNWYKSDEGFIYWLGCNNKFLHELQEKLFK